MSLISIPRNPPTIILFTQDSSLISVWAMLLDRYRGLFSVRLYNGDFGETGCKAVVSFGNSHASQDNIVDRTYATYFGTALEEELQDAIHERPNRSISVGESEIIESGVRHVPYLIFAPTRNSSEDLVSEQFGSYLAMKAVMHLWRYRKWNGRSIQRFIDSIAVPACSVDPLSNDLIARQQFMAMYEALVSPPPAQESMEDLERRHKLFFSGRFTNST